MKAMFATYPMAFHTPGGGEMQLLAYERHLPAHGVEVDRFDPWAPRFFEHDIVHFFSCIGGSSHFCHFVKQLGLPLVVTSSLWVTEATKGDFPTGEIRHQLGLADRVVTNSVLESQSLARLFELPRDLFAEIPNAVDDHFARAADPARFRTAFGIEGAFVLCVANIEPRKNQARLAEAMTTLGDVPLVLIGHVRDADYWTAVQSFGGDRLRFLDWIEQDSPVLASAYAACSVFALPSMFETPGLAALEAAAQGAPIVITREGSTTEYFGALARYVDPQSVPSIAGAIRAALLDPRRDGHVLQTWSDAAGKLAAVYREVLDRRLGRVLS